MFERLPAAVNIGRESARKTRNGHTSDLRGNPLHRFEIAFRRNREPRFNNIDLKPFKLARHLQLLFYIHAETGRLLSIS